MKKSIYDQSEPKDNMMLAALKQAVANVKAANSMTGQTGSIAGTKQTYPAGKSSASLPRPNQVANSNATSEPQDVIGRDERSDAEIAKLLPSYFEVGKWDGLTARAQQRLISQTSLTPQEQWRLLNLKESKLKDLVEQNAADDKYADIIEATQRKGVNFSGADAETLKDEQNALRTMNSARAKQATNAYKNADAATMHDEQRIINITSEGNKALDKLLTSINLDLGSLTSSAKSYIAYARLKIANYAIDGKLTQYALDNIIYDTADSIARNVKPPLGKSYILAERPKRPQEIIPKIGSLNTDVLNKEEWEQLYASSNEKYKQDVYLEAAEAYSNDLKNGTAYLRDFQKYYDRAVLKYYNNCVKPIYFKKDKYGKGIGESIPIGELIPPDRNDLGAQIARTALELIGLPFGHEAGQGNRPKLKIDCQGLVRWALAELNPEWSDHGIGKGARYQINHTDEVWDLSEGFEIGIGWEPGDLIFWMGEETGKIKHVAIFAGWYNEEPYMIEAFNNGVVVNPVRKNTKNNDGEDSFLYQVNRMIPEDLQAYAEGYLSR